MVNNMDKDKGNNRGNKLKVGVLFGGRSGEHDVSLNSATAVIGALDPAKYEVIPIGITRTGQWLTGGNPMQVLKSGNERTISEQVSIPADPSQQALISIDENQQVKHLKLDVVIPVLHGTFGEDGTVQGLLEIANIPYVGAGVLGSAVGMDKGIMKAVFREAGLPGVDYRVYRRLEWRRNSRQIMDDIEQALGYPCFVKPVCLGSSVGISKAHDRKELPGAMDLAASYDRKIIVEASMENCREIECSVLGNDEPIASIPGEVVPAGEFYDYHAKYVNEDSKLIIPANLDKTAIQEVQRQAVEAFKAIDCCGMARVDFFVNKDGSKIVLNEVNTIPGFTSISMYPKLWEASGLNMPELLDRLIELALERHEDQSSSTTLFSV